MTSSLNPYSSLCFFQRGVSLRPRVLLHPIRRGLRERGQAGQRRFHRGKLRGQHGSTRGGSQYRIRGRRSKKPLLYCKAVTKKKCMRMYYALMYLEMLYVLFLKLQIIFKLDRSTRHFRIFICSATWTEHLSVHAFVPILKQSKIFFFFPGRWRGQPAPRVHQGEDLFPLLLRRRLQVRGGHSGDEIGAQRRHDSRLDRAVPKFEIIWDTAKVLLK